MTCSSRRDARRAGGRPEEPETCASPQSCPVETRCAGPRYRPCIDVIRAHEEKTRICAALEAIADDLPARVDRLRCLAVASSLVPLLRECHRFEEETIFPAYAVARGAGPVLDRLRSEHLADEGAAEDLTEILLRIGHGQAIENPEALGYMLRGFFESLRRHIAFERDHVLPAIGTRDIAPPP